MKQRTRKSRRTMVRIGATGFERDPKDADRTRNRARVGVNHFALLVCGTLTLLPLVASCATSPPKRLAPAPPSEDDRDVLFALSRLLGGPPPKAHANDPLAAAPEIGFERTQVELARSPALQRRATTIVVRTIKARVAEIEIRFQGGCDATCSQTIENAVTKWLGRPHVVTEGNAKIAAFAFDTTDVVIEAYPQRPSLTRLLIKCRPLLAAGAGRPAILPSIGVRPTPDASPACRELPKPATNDEVSGVENAP